MHVAEPGGAEQSRKDEVGICMRQEAPLGGVCLVCLTLSDSLRVRSRSSLSWRKRLMSFIDHKLIQRVEERLVVRGGGSPSE